MENQNVTRVVAHFAANPAAWVAAELAAYTYEFDAGNFRAHEYAMDAAHDAAWGAGTSGALRDSLWAGRDAVTAANLGDDSCLAMAAVTGACAALVAWGDCAYILDMPVDTVREMALAGSAQASLLLRAVLAMAP